MSEQPQLAGRGLWRDEGFAVEFAVLFGVAELLGPERERVGDEVGDVAGADLAAAELGVVQPAAARRADQRFDALDAVRIAAAQPIEEDVRTVVGSFSST